MEAAVSRLAGEPAGVLGASRTDSGVHALGQVANFLTASRIPAHGFFKALNSMLPPDVSVRSAEDAGLDFDSRRSAKGKRYSYVLLNRRGKSAIGRDGFWEVPRPLDLEKMKAAAACLVGEHDFSSFRAADCQNPDPVKRLARAEVDKAGEDLLLFSFEGSAFLKQMVRNIVGTLVEVGRGRLAPEEVAVILAAKNRRLAGPTAPARGLYLVEVLY